MCSPKVIILAQHLIAINPFSHLSLAYLVTFVHFLSLTHFSKMNLKQSFGPCQRTPLFDLFPMSSLFILICEVILMLFGFYVQLLSLCNKLLVIRLGLLFVGLLGRFIHLFLAYIFELLFIFLYRLNSLFMFIKKRVYYKKSNL